MTTRHGHQTNDSTTHNKKNNQNNNNNNSTTGSPRTDALRAYAPELLLRHVAQRNQAESADAPAALPHCAHKQGALLFADVSGFTQLTQQLQQRLGAAPHPSPIGRTGRVAAAREPRA